jgi:periplasmic copper chaperone A
MQSGRLFQFNNLNFLLPGFLSLLMTLACSSNASELTIKDAWIRLAPPTVAVNAAYMSLINNTGHMIRITKIHADCCAMASFHETRLDGDRVTMVHLDQLDIFPHSTIGLAPGGLHIMLMQPINRLEEGDQVKMQLTLDDGRIQKINVSVKASHE